MQDSHLSIRASSYFVPCAPCLPHPNPGSSGHAELLGSHLALVIYVTTEFVQCQRTHTPGSLAHS